MSRPFAGMMAGMLENRSVRTLPVVIALTVANALAGAQAPAAKPWMDDKLSVDERVAMVMKELTLDEKIELLHGNGMRDWPGLSKKLQERQVLNNGGAGFVLGVPRLGIPMIQNSDAAYGVRNSADNGRYSTALPSNLGSAASWDKEGACAYGALIGRELRAQGYNMTLGGGVNLNRDPRNGRTFEYMGEDPVLAGYLVAERIRCEGDTGIISDIKHYAANDQESGRMNVNSVIDERSLRESDLLAFELGVKRGNPKAVMCSYNGTNGDYGCQNKYLLTDVLKKEWGFKGFVISDWGGTHSTEKASAAGLDQEQPLDTFYGDKLKEAVVAGRVPMAELNDHVRRVLWAEFASGIVSHPVKKSVVDPQAGFEVARRIEEQSIVLLKNQGGVLPLGTGLKTVAVIGRNADKGMLSGGGSAQVDPPNEPAGMFWRREVWFPTSPLQAMEAKAAGTKFTFASGENVAEAVAQAKQADVAVVFVWQWEAEDADLATLALPGKQDALVSAVAKVNPHTVVVVESGTAVLMPWVNEPAAIVEAWYSGSKGADALANVLYGDVNPSGKLPITFPLSEGDLPRKAVVQPPKPAMSAGTEHQDGQLPEGVLAFDVNYTEGARVGYKWFETEKKQVLFPFGFGMSYTSFRYTDLKATAKEITVTVTNTGSRKGAEVAEVYAMLPEAAGESWKRLIGWQKVELAPGESRTLHITPEPLALEIFDAGQHKWTHVPGTYTVMAGPSSAELPLKVSVTM